MAYSLLIHMKARSVTVKPGDRVRQGQVVGCIGFTGDSIFPHLHYSFMDGGEAFKAWGLPAYFRTSAEFWRRVGRRWSVGGGFRGFPGERRCVFRCKVGEAHLHPLRLRIEASVLAIVIGSGANRDKGLKIRVTTKKAPGAGH